MRILKLDNTVFDLDTLPEEVNSFTNKQTIHLRLKKADWNI